MATLSFLPELCFHCQEMFTPTLPLDQAYFYLGPDDCPHGGFGKKGPYLVCKDCMAAMRVILNSWRTGRFDILLDGTNRICFNMNPDHLPITLKHFEELKKANDEFQKLRMEKSSELLPAIKKKAISMRLAGNFLRRPIELPVPQSDWNPPETGEASTECIVAGSD